MQLAPSAKRGGWGRRTPPPAAASSVLVEPNGSTGRPASGSGEDVDLVIHCSLPPMLDPSSTWLGSTPDRAILLATKGVTRFGNVRRTVEMLDRVGVRVVASVMLPFRMKPRPTAPVQKLPLEQASAVATALER